MSFIPLTLLYECLKSPFYAKCCLCGNRHIQLHENLIFAGEQVKEVFAILPLCQDCHQIEKRRDIKEKLDWMMLNRMSEEQIKYYSKVENLTIKKDRLNFKFGGTFSEKKYD